MSEQGQRVLSAIQPTGDMHLGNYFGAIQNWVQLQDQYECVYGVVDYHSMTMPYDPQALYANTQNMVIDLLACGIDPDKSVLFIQSLVPEHTELAWVLNCVTSYGELTRMTQFKDKTDQLQQKDKDALISAGLFTYPVLQAADILIYRADYVPVGKDQEQHLELTRNSAVRFNNQFGEWFPLPEPLFTEVPKVMSLADPTKKMSKSLGEKHYIRIFEEEAVLRKKVKKAVTDSGDTPEGEISPGVANLFSLLKACGNGEAAQNFEKDYKDGTIRYGDLKNAVADELVTLTGELREKRAAIAADTERVDRIIRESSEKARAIARETMDEVRRLTGLPSYS